MDISEPTPDVRELSGDVRSAWQRFLDGFEPLRPELYRYCRALTRSPWEAEDLVQDVMAKAFVTLGTVFRDLPNPRAWLFRVASNLWVDRARRAQRELPGESVASTEGTPQTDPRELREAAGSLLVRLSPQERASLVLKDVFEFSIDEIAGALSTSAGAVKAALHRGRGRLEQLSEEPAARAPAREALDVFCDAFNARDLERLTALLLDSAIVEIVGVVTEYGPDAPADPRTGSFAGTLAPLGFDERGGVPAPLLEGYLGTSPRCEVRAYRGDWVLLFWYEHASGPLVRSVMRLEAEGTQLSRVKNYFFTPDVIEAVCQELQVPYRVNGYRYWP